MDDTYPHDEAATSDSVDLADDSIAVFGTLESELGEPWDDSTSYAQALLGEAGDAIFLIDPVTDKILDANEAASEYLGYSREQFLRMRSSDLIADDSMKDREQRRTRIRKGGIHTFEVSHRRRDGSTVPVEIRVVIVEIDGRPVAQTIVRDVAKRKRVVEALRETEFRFRKVFDDSAIGMTVIDEKGRYRAVNQAFCDMVGYTHDELIGKDVWDITHPDDRKFEEGSRSRILADRSQPVFREKRYLHKDGHVVWGALTASPYRDSTGKIVYQMGQVQDITQRKIAEEGLRASEQRFRDFASASADRFWETDETHRFTYMSPVPADSNLLPTEAFIGQRRLNFIEIKDDTEKFKAQAETLAARRPFRDFRFKILDCAGEIAHLRVNGTPFFDADGKFKGYRGTVVDETPEVKARQQMENVQTRFFDALEGVSEGAILWDEHGRLVMCNSRYRNNHPEMAHYLEPGILHAEFVRALAGTSKIVEAEADLEKWIAQRIYEFSNVRDVIRESEVDGRWMRVRGKTLADGSRLTMVSDITEEKRRDEQLRQAQKMEAVGQLTGGIAHDFNNMLAAILGNLELAQPQIQDRPDVAKRLDRAIGAVQKGATLVSRLLAFSRKQALEPTPTNVNELIRDIEELMQRTLGEHVKIELDLADDLWLASIDRNQTDNAILNLAINARDAMSGGGTLTIATANSTLDGAPPLDAADAPKGDFVAISVRDRGCGMTEEVLASAFEPFFTTKDVGVGSGLGLSMVYGFVKQSGGHVDIDSRPGEGTTVTIYLPRYARA